MKLATAEEVLAKVGASSHQDTLESADAALEFATAEISNVLGTGFTLGTYRDYYSYTPSRYSSGWTPQRMLLSRGLLDASADINVWLSTDGSALSQGALDPVDAIDAENYVYDLEQGWFKLLTPPYTGLQTIAIEYDAGFEDEGADVPFWLKQAAIAYAVQNLQLHGVGYNKKEVRFKSGTQRSVAYSTLSQHIRTKQGIYPSTSITVSV